MIGHLRVDPELRGFAGQPIAFLQAGQLQLGKAVHDDQPIEAAVGAGLDHQRRVNNRDGPGISRRHRA